MNALVFIAAVVAFVVACAGVVTNQPQDRILVAMMLSANLFLAAIWGKL